MTKSELFIISSHHIPIIKKQHPMVGGGTYTICITCQEGEGWPCDARKLLDHIEAKIDEV